MEILVSKLRPLHYPVLDGPTLTAVSPQERSRSPEVRGFVDFLSANLVPALASQPPG